MGSLVPRVGQTWTTIKAGLKLGDRRTGASLAQRFVHGSLWSLIGAVGTQSLTLLASVFVARLLGKELFGQFSFLQGTVMTAATFGGFGLGLTATRYVAYYRRDDPARAGSFIRFVMSITSAISALGATLMAIGAPYFAIHVFRLPELSTCIRWAALYLFCVTVNGVQTGILAGFESFRAIANVNITRGIATVILTVPCVWLWNLEGAVAAMGLAGAVAYMMSLFQIASVTRAHGIPSAPSIDWSHAKVLWSFSLPTVMAEVLVSPVTWLACLWLSRQPNGYAELGLFGAANQWKSGISFIPLVLSVPLLPLLTSLANEREKTFNRLVLFSAALNTGVAAIAGLIVLLALPFISLSYGKSFAGLNAILVPMMAAGAISCAAMTIGNALASEERMWVGFSLNLIWAGCLLTTAYFAIPLAGARGLAYSFLAAYVLHVFTTGYCVLSGRLKSNKGSLTGLWCETASSGIKTQ